MTWYLAFDSLEPKVAHCSSPQWLWVVLVQVDVIRLGQRSPPTLQVSLHGVHHLGAEPELVNQIDDEEKRQAKEILEEIRRIWRPTDGEETDVENASDDDHTGREQIHAPGRPEPVAVGVPLLESTVALGPKRSVHIPVRNGDDRPRDKTDKGRDGAKPSEGDGTGCGAVDIGQNTGHCDTAQQRPVRAALSVDAVEDWRHHTHASHCGLNPRRLVQTLGADAGKSNQQNDVGNIRKDFDAGVVHGDDEGRGRDVSACVEQLRRSVWHRDRDKCDPEGVDNHQAGDDIDTGPRHGEPRHGGLTGRDAHDLLAGQCPCGQQESIRDTLELISWLWRSRGASEPYLEAVRECWKLCVVDRGGNTSGGTSSADNRDHWQNHHDHEGYFCSPCGELPFGVPSHRHA